MSLIEYKGHKTVNGSAVFAIDIEDYFFNIHISVHRPKTNPWTLINITLNGCKLMQQTVNKKISLPVLIFNQIIKSLINMPNKCPLKKV